MVRTGCGGLESGRKKPCGRLQDPPAEIFEVGTAENAAPALHGAQLRRILDLPQKARQRLEGRPQAARGAVRDRQQQLLLPAVPRLAPHTPASIFGRLVCASRRASGEISRTNSDHQL